MNVNELVRPIIAIKDFTNDSDGRLQQSRRREQRYRTDEGAVSLFNDKNSN